jgi:NADPH-dependent 2,4-dienoyl-CoA reductase/sulfur reductase-like enzyme
VIIEKYDVVIIGAGPAGIAASVKATELGLKTILLENREILGGIPLQCIHPGFGLHYFKEDLTGTQFIYRFLDKMNKLGVEYIVNAYVHSIEYRDYMEKVVNVITRKGVLKLYAKAIIYTTGARERTIFEIGIVGDRPDGIYTAGEAQTMMDIFGIMPGREIVIIGSGDVGLIMARRFALEGAKVKAVIEIMPYPGGLMRNVVQCLRDFNIPLLLSHAVVRVVGKTRVEKVIVTRVDENLKPIPGTEFEIPCDTVIIAAGLRPDVYLLEKLGVAMDPATGGPVVNELLETTVPGVFVAGNALVVNDLADYATEQGELAAEGAKMFIDGSGIPAEDWKPVKRGRNIRFAIPHYISGKRDVTILARVTRPEKRVFVKVPELGYKVFHMAVRPAEMIRLDLRKEVLSKASGSITIEVEPIEQRA